MKTRLRTEPSLFEAATVDDNRDASASRAEKVSVAGRSARPQCKEVNMSGPIAGMASSAAPGAAGIGEGADDGQMFQKALNDLGMQIAQNSMDHMNEAMSDTEEESEDA